MPPKATNTPTAESRTYSQAEVDEMLATQKTATERQTARLSALVVNERLSRALDASGVLPSALSSAARALATHTTFELGEDDEDDRLVVRLEGQSFEGSRLDKAAERFLELKSFFRGDASNGSGSKRPSAGRDSRTSPTTKSSGSPAFESGARKPHGHQR